MHGNEKKHEQKINEPVHTRQLLDDSDSVHSEFDVPNLIPEDWFSNDLANTSMPPVQIDEPIATSSESEPMVHSFVDSTPETIIPSVTEQLAWEDVTQTIQPSVSTTEPKSDEFFLSHLQHLWMCIHHNQ